MKVILAQVLALTEAGDPAWLDELGVSGLGLLVVLLGFAALILGLRGLRALVALLPVTKSQRERLRRAGPVVEALAVVLFVGLVVPRMFGLDREWSALVLAGVLIALVVVSWSAIRDLVNGMFIKSGELCQVGDRVEVDEVQGQVKRLGYRVLTLETDAGEEVFIPYGRLSRRSLVRTPRLEGVHRHSFELELPPAGDLDSVAAIAAIKGLALRCHWACVVRAPEVEALADGRLRVHVFALGREHGAAVEASVRRGLVG